MKLLVDYIKLQDHYLTLVDTQYSHMEPSISLLLQIFLMLVQHFHAYHIVELVVKPIIVLHGKLDLSLAIDCGSSMIGYAVSI